MQFHSPENTQTMQYESLFYELQAESTLIVPICCIHVLHFYRNIYITVLKTISYSLFRHRVLPVS